MKKTLAIAICLLMVPMAALAAHKSTGPSKAAIAACAGKAAGDAVQLPGKKKGKMVNATCQEVKGKLVAVPAPKAPKAPKATATPAAEAPAATAAPAAEVPAATTAPAAEAPAGTK